MQISADLILCMWDQLIRGLGFADHTQERLKHVMEENVISTYIFFNDSLLIQESWIALMFVFILIV